MNIFVSNACLYYVVIWDWDAYQFFPCFKSHIILIRNNLMKKSVTCQVINLRNCLLK